MSDDEELVRGLIEGRATAFDLAYERYRARLYGFLLRMCRRRDIAEELLQETWLRLARHATSLRRDTHLAAWLFTVARNLARSHSRWATMNADAMGEMKRLVNPAPADPVFDAAAANQAQRLLESALATLAPKYREVLLLVCVEQMDHDAAAAILGIRAATLRKRLSRGRASLAETLAHNALPSRQLRSA